MTLILRSNAKFTGSNLIDGLDDYVNRVQADGGTIADMQSLRDAFLFAQSHGLADANKTFTAVSAQWGYKADASGNLVKLYSLYNPDGDLIMHGSSMTVTTSTSGINTVFNNADANALLRTDVELPTNIISQIVVTEPTGNRSSTRYHAGVAPLVNSPDGADKLVRIIYTSDNKAGGYYNYNKFDLMSDTISDLHNLKYVAQGICYDSNDATAYAYLNGDVIASSSAGTLPSTNNQNYPFFGTAHQPATGSGTFLGNMHEMWLLTNGTKQQTQAITARANTYP